MYFIKHYIPCLAALWVLLLIACTSDDGGTGEEARALVPTAGFGVGSQLGDTNFKAGDIVWAWADRYGTHDGYIKAWKLTATGVDGKFDSPYPKQWPKDFSDLSIQAFHGEFNDDIVEDETELSTLAHTISTDQSISDNRDRSDLLYAVLSPANHQSKLLFFHMLSKIKIILKDTEDLGGVSEVSITNADMSFQNVATTVDAYNMIPADSVGITSDKKYLYFKVNEDYICQGNALLSVRDESKKKLWSWHIWVTDENLSSATNVPITNHKNTVYNLMAVPLGHCNPDRRTYKPREIKFAFEQEGSGMTADVSFSQATTSYQEYGLNVTYYQYGRSTPEGRIGSGITTALKTLYDVKEYPVTSINKAVARGIAIQNPTTHYYVERGEWCSKRLQRNYWDVKNTVKGVYDKATNPSIKTIYDPCPVGYKVPEPEVFTGFTTTGNNSTSKATFNVSGTWNKGWKFYTEPNKQGAIFYLYAFYDISYTGTVYGGIGTMLRVRTTGSTEYNNLDCGLGLYFTSSTIETQNKSRRCTGLTIIPESDD